MLQKIFGKLCQVDIIKQIFEMLFVNTSEKKMKRLLWLDGQRVAYYLQTIIFYLQTILRGASYPT